MKKSSADNQHRKGNLEEVFRHGLEQGEATPRADLWSSIDQQLDQQAGKRKRRAGYLALLSALLLLLIGSVALYKFLPGSGRPEIAKATSEPAMKQKVNTEKATGSSADEIAGLEDLKAMPSESKSGAESAQHPTPGGEIMTSDVTENNIAGTRHQPNHTSDATSGTGNQPNTQKAPLSAQRNKAAMGKIKAATNQNSFVTGNQLALSGAKENAAERKAKQASRKETIKEAAGASHNNKSGKVKNSQVAEQDMALEASRAVNQTSENTAVPPTFANASPDNSSVKSDQNNSAPGAEKNTDQLSLPSTKQAAGIKNTASAEEIAAAEAAKPDSGKKEFTIADSVMTPPAISEPGGKRRWVFSASYASYQFEQGLVIGTKAPKTTQPLNNSDVTRYQQAAQEFNELTTPSTSYRIELRAGFWLKNRLRIEGGLSYANNKAVTQSTYVIQSFVRNADGNMLLSGESSVLEPVMNTVQRDSVAVRKGPAYETTYQYQFLAVPVRVIYQSDTDEWHWFASGGISGGMLLSSSIETSKANGNREHLATAASLRKWQATGLFSFGLGYQINDRFCLQAGPDLSYSVNSLLGSKRSGVRQKNPYSVGLTGGLTYTFR